MQKQPMSINRLYELLYRSLNYLENEYGEIMGTDIEDEIGITQEEYDEILTQSRFTPANCDFTLSSQNLEDK